MLPPCEGIVKIAAKLLCRSTLYLNDIVFTEDHNSAFEGIQTKHEQIKRQKRHKNVLLLSPMCRLYSLHSERIYSHTHLQL